MPIRLTDRRGSTGSRTVNTGGVRGRRSGFNTSLVGYDLREIPDNEFQIIGNSLSEYAFKKQQIEERAETLAKAKDKNKLDAFRSAMELQRERLSIELDERRRKEGLSTDHLRNTFESRIDEFANNYLLDYEPGEENLDSWNEVRDRIIDTAKLNYQGKEIREYAVDDVKSDLLNISSDTIEKAAISGQRGDIAQFFDYMSKMDDSFASVDFHIVYTPEQQERFISEVSRNAIIEFGKQLANHHPDSFQGLMSDEDDILTKFLSNSGLSDVKNELMEISWKAKRREIILDNERQDSIVGSFKNEILSDVPKTRDEIDRLEIEDSRKAVLKGFLDSYNEQVKNSQYSSRYVDYILSLGGTFEGHPNEQRHVDRWYDEKVKLIREEFDSPQEQLLESSKRVKEIGLIPTQFKTTIESMFHSPDPDSFSTAFMVLENLSKRDFIEDPIRGPSDSRTRDYTILNQFSDSVVEQYIARSRGFSYEDIRNNLSNDKVQNRVVNDFVNNRIDKLFDKVSSQDFQNFANHLDFGGSIPVDIPLPEMFLFDSKRIMKEKFISTGDFDLASRLTAFEISKTWGWNKEFNYLEYRPIMKEYGVAENILERSTESWLKSVKGEKESERILDLGTGHFRFQQGTDADPRYLFIYFEDDEISPTVIRATFGREHILANSEEESFFQKWLRTWTEGSFPNVVSGEDTP